MYRLIKNTLIEPMPCRYFVLLSLCLSLMLVSCLPPPIAIKPKPKEKAPYSLNTAPRLPRVNHEEEKFRQRRPLPLEQLRYEGALWRGESSWGNIMRDHRARYLGDVLLVTDVQNMVGQNEGAPAAGEGEVPNLAEQERLAIQNGVEEIGSRVVRLLDNGTMVIYGERIDYRDSNNTQFITVLKGIVRPEDVTVENEIIATKVARFELKTTRRVRQSRTR